MNSTSPRRNSLVPQADQAKPDNGHAVAIRAAHDLANAGVPVFVAKLLSNGDPDRSDKRWLNWQNKKAGPASHRAISAWKPGLALCAVTGIAADVIDIDPRNGGSLSLKRFNKELGDDGPETYWRVRTPSGGWHLYIAPLGIGGRNGFLPGMDLKAGNPDGTGRGFVFLPPTVRPSKETGELCAYVAEEAWQTPRADDRTGEPMIAWLSELRPRAAGTGRQPVSELKAACLDAGAGGQREALLRYVHELERRGIEREDIIDLLRVLCGKMENYNPRDPWRERDLCDLLHKDGEVVGDADADEAAILSELPGVRGKIAARDMAVEEAAFWAAHPVLTHIREFALAKQSGPWATLGESLAEAICHTPPSLQLPDLVGGNGTLNMLIALTGKSGAGKGAAARAARSAFKWHGILGSESDEATIPEKIERIPLGSGEGITKSFGYNRKNAETGRHELVRTNWSAIISINEIDTLKSQTDRSGATVSPQLRQLYSGEDLGFGYSDPSKRVIIPEHSYRSCVIAGVQPGRGEIILGDTDGGFAQRWLWLPAADPHAPDSPPVPPAAMEWRPPEAIEAMSVSGEGEAVVMGVCGAAREATREIRLAGLRGYGDDLEAHSNYTRLKVAAGLALLFGNVAIGDSEWGLAGYIMSMSDRTRDAVSALLRDKAAEANVARGRAEGIRREVAESTTHKAAKDRIAKNVLGKMPTGGKYIAHGALRKLIAKRDHEFLEEVLSDLVESKVLVREEFTANTGSAAVRYRRVPK